MTRRLSGRVAKLENKAGGTKDHFRIAADESEVQAIEAWWHDSPFSKMPGHKLWIITSTLPKKDPNL